MPTAWTDRVWQEFRAGNLTRASRDVLLTLRTFRGAGGTAWPSHATLADRARCSVSTVARALQAARDCGLVAWSARRVRAGWRMLRSSNLYCFLTPDRPPEPRARLRRSTDRQNSAGGERKKISGTAAPSLPPGWEPSEAERRAAQAALAAIRAQRAATVASLLTGGRRAAAQGLSR